MFWTGIRRGDSHTNYCEDSLFIQEYTSLIVGGVFDGCSSGKRCHIASGMLAYAFRKSFNDWHLYMDEFKEAISYFTSAHFIKPIKDAIRLYEASVGTLKLDNLETLSTALVFIYSPFERKLIVFTLGDGCYMVNSKKYEIYYEGNAPDYIAYHFGENLSDLNEYVQDNMRTFDNVNSFSICSDGITAIREVRPTVTPEPISYLLTDLSLSHSQAMLTRKFNIISKDHTFDDDIAIIRYESI